MKGKMLPTERTIVTGTGKGYLIKGRKYGLDPGTAKNLISKGFAESYSKSDVGEKFKEAVK